MVTDFNILLVNPACQDKRVTDDDARQVPIGLYYIAALLLDNGFKATILNLAGLDADPVNVFREQIRAHPPDLIGFSVTNPSRLNAMACAVVSRELLPSTPVVFGGPAPTFLYNHILNACPAVDYIVLGEGEITLLEIARAVQAKHPVDSKINGIVYRGAAGLVKTDPRYPIANLDELARPSDYFTTPHLSMSRGCPGKCTFCGSPKFWPDRQVRFHSPKWMEKEIQTHAAKGVTHFYFSDDTFTMDKPRVLELCQRIQGINTSQGLNITWNAISRADAVDPDILFAMRRAGCIQISYGVESGAASIRKTLGKPIDAETIIRAFSQTVSFGILPRAYFIYGSPNETDQTIKESIDLLYQISPLSAVFYMLVLFPGTHLYTLAKNKGWVSDDVWHQNIEDLPWFELDDQLDFKTVKQFGDRLRSAFYSRVHSFAKNIKLVDEPELFDSHADFLSRLAMTFSHGEYAADPRVPNSEETAMNLYQQALDYAPNARAFLGLGMVYQKKRQFSKAIDILSRGLSRFTGHKDLGICMGVCLMNQRNFKSALEVFTTLEPSPETEHYIRICRNQL